MPRSSEAAFLLPGRASRPGRSASRLMPSQRRGGHGRKAARRGGQARVLSPLQRPLASFLFDLTEAILIAHQASALMKRLIRCAKGRKTALNRQSARDGNFQKCMFSLRKTLFFEIMPRSARPS
jgi:hypothetical protein